MSTVFEGVLVLYFGIFEYLFIVIYNIVIYNVVIYIYIYIYIYILTRAGKSSNKIVAAFSCSC